MFAAKVALLLFLLPLLIESGKVQNSLKNVAKRYLDFSDRVWLEDLKSPGFQYKHMLSSNVTKVKWQNAHTIITKFAEASSTQNAYFRDSLRWIESILSPDLTTEICGDDQKFNAYQYIKYMSQMATQYKINPHKMLVQYTVLDSPKDELEVYMKFDQTDKNDVTAVMHYQISLKATFVRAYNDSIFSITNIVQGGTCLEHGDVGYVSLKQEQEIEQFLKKHPHPDTLLNLFTPKVFQFSEESKSVEMNHLPTGWLLGLHREAIIGICHEPGAALVNYTRDEFRSWYQRFGQMWHPKAGDDEAVTVQVLDMKDCVVNARITWRLQCGAIDDATVHEWNFKIVADVGLAGSEPLWTISKIDVLCPPTLPNIMDENYMSYREVMGATFNLYVNDNKQWYTATDFAKHFKKHGETVELWSCQERIQDIDELPKSFFIYDRYWNATMIGYIIKTGLEPLPAAEETTVSLRMKMQPPSEPPIPGDLFGSDWKFYIRWDKMDQFYYIYKAVFTCPLYMRPEDGTLRHLKHFGIGNGRK